MAVAGVRPVCQSVRAGVGPYRLALSSAARPASIETKMTLQTRGQLVVVVVVVVIATTFVWDLGIV